MGDKNNQQLIKFIMKFLDFVNKKYKRISIKTLLILHHLHEHKDTGETFNTTYYSKIIGSSTQSAAMIISRLEKRGLVNKTRNSFDERLVKITLTKKGEQITRDIFEF